MKRLILFLFVVATCVALCACGGDVKISEGLGFSLNDDAQSYCVSGIGTCKDKNVVIPSTYNGLPVTSIGYSAFYYCSSLSSIVIPDSVTSIGSYAFSACHSLTSVTIGNGVTSIGGDAFYGTAYYEDSANWTDDVLYIGNHLIKAKSDISGAYTIREGTKCIANGAFSDCDSPPRIDDDAFYGCRSLTSIMIPDSVTSIGDWAFRDCSSLTSITVAAGNPVYHSAGNCLIETASKTLIAGCSTSVIPTDGSVTSIDWCAFYNCSSLMRIVIPDSVTSIGGDAFSGCSSLTSITFSGTKAQWDAISKGYGWNEDTGAYTIHCTDGDIEK